MKLKKEVRLAAGGLICLVGLCVGIHIGIIWGFVDSTVGIIRSINATEFFFYLFRMIFVGSIGVAGGVVIFWFGGTFGLDNLKKKKEVEEIKKIIRRKYESKKT